MTAFTARYSLLLVDLVKHGYFVENTNFMNLRDQDFCFLSGRDVLL